MAATQYRIFLATPGDLQKERQIVRDVVADYARLTPAAAGIGFAVVGWEELGRGVGNPEEQILAELRQCDYLILLLGARWGTAPGGAAGYTSGTEAEFYEAVTCYNTAASPMRGISVFFRAVNQQAMADPGPQLQRVIEFRKHLEAAQEIFYGEFDDETSLRRRIDRQLAEWSLEVAAAPLKHSVRPVTIARPSLPQPQAEAARTQAATREEAEKLIAAGRFTEADMMFAQLTVDETDIDSMIVYGRFLRDRGKFARATGIFTRVLEIAEIQQAVAEQALAVENLGNIQRRRNQLAEAEASYKRAIELFTSLGAPGALGVARQYGHLGLLARVRGAWQESLDLHEKAEQIFYQHLDIEGIAKQHSRKGKVYQAMGDLKKAEEYFRKALDAELKMAIPRNVAVVSGHLASNYIMQGQLERAEEMCRLCLKNNEAAGDSWGLATCDRYRGWIALLHRDLVQARQYLDKAEQAYRRMGILRDLDDTRVLLAQLERAAQDANAAVDAGGP